MLAFRRAEAVQYASQGEQRALPAREALTSFEVRRPGAGGGARARGAARCSAHPRCHVHAAEPERAVPIQSPIQI
jgi:hypothetical protein